MLYIIIIHNTMRLHGVTGAGCGFLSNTVYDTVEAHSCVDNSEIH